MIFFFHNSIEQFSSMNFIDDNITLQCEKVGHACFEAVAKVSTVTLTLKALHYSLQAAGVQIPWCWCASPLSSWGGGDVPWLSVLV